NPGRATPTTIDGPYALYAVACPSTSQCTAVDAQGGAVTFDPKKPGSPTRILAGCTGAYAGCGVLADVACPSTNPCTAVDHDAQEVTFNPNRSEERRVGKE